VSAEAEQQQQERRYANAERDGWHVRRTCECVKPLERLVGGDGYITVVCLRCRRRLRPPNTR
jgi:hypothetical protein